MKFGNILVKITYICAYSIDLSIDLIWILATVGMNLKNVINIFRLVILSVLGC